MPNYPELAAKGAYSKYERYSLNDVEDVIEHAK